MGLCGEVGEDGVVGEVKQAPLAEWRLLDTLQAPWEVLDEAYWEDVDRVCAATDRFVLMPWHCDPFERMQFLRGTQNLFMDLAWGAPEALPAARLGFRIHEPRDRVVVQDGHRRHPFFG